MSAIPHGVGAAPGGQKGKLMCIKVRLLDDTVAVFHLGQKATGQNLLDEVARHLNVLEVDYFGLEFIDSTGTHCWLDKEKPILRQIASTADAKFYFVVKFYTPNPIDLEEEYTRYLFTMQIRRDLCVGELHCAEATAALLVAHLVQSECGDFCPDDYHDATYLSNTRFVPHQTIEFQQKVMENHRALIGMLPAESDLALLEIARRCDFYGVKFHPAKDVEHTEACLAVVHLGIKVFHLLHCVSTFSWAKIRKLSFKRKKLLIKLHPDSYQYYKETIEFSFATRNECKTFWKKCVEHHAFFRCNVVEQSRKDHTLFSKGSSFRYQGRTQKQLIDYVREHHRRREPFTRPLRSAASNRAYSTLAGYATFGGQHNHRNGTLDARGHDRSGGQTAAVTTSAELQSARERLRETRRVEPMQREEANEMYLSLPNVLSDDIQLVCKELELESGQPPKSASGDNFLEMNRKEFDNMSEDSYKLSDNEKSTRSDVGIGTRQQQQLYNTTFTAKRVGNVIVKRVLSNRRSSTSYTDDEESTSFDPPRHHVKEFPFRHHRNTNIVPIDIDGPNVDLTKRMTSTTVDGPDRAIYTSSGALLLKPKVLSTETKEDLYSTVKVSPDSGHYSTIVSPSARTEPTYGAIGPLPGAVFSKDTIVITPNGVKSKTKPVPPPKPAKPVVPPHGVNSSSRSSSSDRHPVVNLSNIDNVENTADTTEVKRTTPARPALISIQSEDHPEVQKCHLFNSDIPYTLTMRTVDSADAPPLSTFRSDYESLSLKRVKPTQTHEKFERRKSLDLVPKRSLPSPGNFSAQDHTISPTTPEGDVLEYIMRRRSLSQERSALTKRNRRSDPRRLTQPVRFDLPPSPDMIAGGSTPFLALASGTTAVEVDAPTSTVTIQMTQMTTFERAYSEESDALPPPPELKQVMDPKDLRHLVDTTESITEIRPPPPLIPPKSQDAMQKVSRIKGLVQPLDDLAQELSEIAAPVTSTSTSNKGQSPPFIDDSPKSVDDSHGEGATRSEGGVLWTDF